MAGELREENRETANIWGIQNEGGKKAQGYGTAEPIKTKDPIFCSRILPALAS